MYGVIRKQNEFNEVYSDHRRFPGRRFTFLVYNGTAPHLYVGIVAGKKVGKAVKRNKVKRRIRAFIREHGQYHELPEKILIIARIGAAEANWNELSFELERFFSRLSAGVSS